MNGEKYKDYNQNQTEAQKVTVETAQKENEKE
jgi:hypothetical protein